MKNYYTQIREIGSEFVLFGGYDPDNLSELSRAPSYEAADRFRMFRASRLAAGVRHVDHGFIPLVLMQGHVPGH